MAGQSFNPSAKAHKSVLDKIVNEEREEIETERRRMLKNQSQPTMRPEDFSSESEEEESDSDQSKDLDNNYAVGQMPDRLKKKTKKDRRRQVSSAL